MSHNVSYPRSKINESSAHIESGASAHISNEASTHRETESSAHIERTIAKIHDVNLSWDSERERERITHAVHALLSIGSQG